MRELMSYLPINYEDSQETRIIQEAIQPEVLALWDARNDLLLQLDPRTAAWGLDYWESAFGLPTIHSLPYDVRRSRVIARIRGKGTTTVARLKAVVETFCPGCEVTIIEYYSYYVVEIKLTLTDQSVEDTDGLFAELDLIMPAHLAWGISYTIETTGGIIYGACSEMAARMDIWPLVIREIETTGRVFYGAGSEMGGKTEIWPLVARQIESTSKTAAAGALTHHTTMEIYPIGGMANG